MTTRFATKDMLTALAAPTPPEEIGVRPGRGDSGGLDYVTARFVQGRFDSALGPDLWANQFFRDSAGRLVAGVGVLCESGWVWKWDTGTESNIEAEKGEFSDSFKRASVLWGVARDLYPGPKVTKARSEQAHQAEQAVVGQTGLTEKQRGKLFAALREAGVEGDQRKALVYLTVNKHSVKNMDGEDLDKVLAVLEAPRSENPDIWSNVELVQGAK